MVAGRIGEQEERTTATRTGEHKVRMPQGRKTGSNYGGMENQRTGSMDSSKHD